MSIEKGDDMAHLDHYRPGLIINVGYQQNGGTSWTQYAYIALSDYALVEDMRKAVADRAVEAFDKLIAEKYIGARIEQACPTVEPCQEKP